MIFVFNLIVGTGALTLPADIAKAGWLFGIFFIAMLAFISYMTVTFVIETMACSNAIIQWRRLQFLKRDNVMNHIYIYTQTHTHLYVYIKLMCHAHLFRNQARMNMAIIWTNR